MVERGLFRGGDPNNGDKEGERETLADKGAIDSAAASYCIAGGAQQASAASIALPHCLQAWRRLKLPSGRAQVAVPLLFVRR